MGESLNRQRLGWLVALCAAALAVGAGAAFAQKERVFIADGHRYVPEEGQPVDAQQREIGQGLCGIRCNALSGYYDSYMMSPGWRLILVASKQERTVELNNPFLRGQCICTGDEYDADLYFYRPGPPPPPGVTAQGQGAGGHGGGAQKSRARSPGE